MRILVLSFYFPPDLSAGSFRCRALVDALLAALPADARVDVVTTLPNRYSSYQSKAVESEVFDRLHIHRISLPAHRSGMLDQARTFASYVRGVLAHTRNQHFDLVFATSSRLMTAALGAWLGRRKRVPLYLDIRDIFVDTIADVLPARLARLLVPVFSRIEGYTVRSAARINLVSPGFLDYFVSRHGDRGYRTFTNGIDAEFTQVPLAPHAPSADGRRLVVYAGNIGEGQGLENILPDLACLLRDRARFLVIGDGGRRERLVRSLEEAGCDNVELRPPVSRQALLQCYLDADLLFLHLNDYPAFTRVLPSKIFEYAALGKPILAGVGGYAAQFIREEVPGAHVFPPCSAQAGAAAYAEVVFRHFDRQDFIERYDRARIMREMAADVIGVD